MRQSIHIIPAFLLLLIMTPIAPGAGGAMGGHYYRLSSDGKLLQDIDASDSPIVDDSTALIFKLNEGKLTATRLGETKTLWEAAVPQSRFSFTIYAEIPGLLVLLSPNEIIGYDKATGLQKFDEKLPGEYLEPISQYSDRSQGPMRFDAGYKSDEFPYLLDQPTKYVQGDDGKSREVLARPVVLCRIDLSSGKFLWKTTLPAGDAQNNIITAIGPGVAGAQNDFRFYFNPATGEEIKNLPDVANAQVPVVLARETAFHITADAPDTLIASEISTAKTLWHIPFKEQIRQIMPAGPDRLLVVCDKNSYLINSKLATTIGTIPIGGFAQVHAQFTENRIVIQRNDSASFDYKTKALLPQPSKIHVFDSDCKPVWTSDLQKMGAAMVLNKDTITVFEPPPSMGSPERKLMLGPAIHCLNLNDGSERWTWHVPDLNKWEDSYETKITACPDGWLVSAFWVRLD